MDVKTYKPRRDEETGEWVEMDYFELTPDGTFQLYNLKEDPAEKKDLAQEQPEKVAELKSLLDRYRKSGRSTP